jgi:enamine deaminase RidA (YjgF/YER057c/UK114 family)
LKRRVDATNASGSYFGYSRAVRAGSTVFFSAVGASGEDGKVVANGTYAQARFIFGEILRSAELLGAGRDDIVRLRVFATSGFSLEDFRKAYREVFSESKPALTLVYVAGLPVEGSLLEIEAEAVKEGEF